MQRHLLAALLAAAAHAATAQAPNAPDAPNAPKARADGERGTRLLRQPTVSATQVAFVYAGDIWIASRGGGDARRLTSLPTVESSPHFSPDGKLVAFTVTTVRESDNKRHAEVWVVPAAGGEATRYTSPSTESSNPRFSADGKYLLFNSTRPGSKARTWGLRMDQPGGEAQEMNDYPNGSLPRDKSFAVWSEPVTPDSSADSTRRRDPYAAMQPMARPPYGAITQPLDPKRFDGRHIYDMRYKANGQGFVPGPREARVWRPAQIWVQRLDGSAKRQLDTTPYSRRGATVSSDGKWIAFTADPALRPDSVAEAERDSLARLPYDAKRDEVQRNEADVFVVPVTGGQPRRLTTFAGNEGDLAWSPDGKRISFVAAPTRVASRRLYTVDVAGGEPTNLLGTWQYEPDGYEWLPTGEIAMSASVGGRSALFRLDPRTKQPKEVLGGRRRLSDFAFDGAKRTVAYVATSVDAPTELYIANADGTGERKLTSLNDKLNQQIAWSTADRCPHCRRSDPRARVLSHNVQRGLRLAIYDLVRLAKHRPALAVPKHHVTDE